jgi:hypothetical protein
MTYEIGELRLADLLEAIVKAEDRLARLDEAVRRSPVGPGFVERGHFFDAAASMWISGELVHVEDLVLHDAHTGVRTPTHELTVAHAILRSRRRIAVADPDWAVTAAGILNLAGMKIEGSDGGVVDGMSNGEGEGDPCADELDNGNNRDEFVEIDALLDRSQRLLDQVGRKQEPVSTKPMSLMVGELVVRDADWDERDRIRTWRELLAKVERFPPTLGAALLYDAWEVIEPMQRQNWLGGQLASAYLRARGKMTSHLPAFNVGLKAVSRERRRASARTTRLVAILDAMSAGADIGTKEIARLALAREQMERTLRGRRSSSNLPAVIDLVLSQPMVSTEMIARAANVTPRGALNLITELRVREMTGRGRYRAWGVI